jgi:hypothetical protein
MIILSNYCPVCLNPSGERFTAVKINKLEGKVDPHQKICVVDRRNGHRLFDLKGAGSKCGKRMCREICMVCARAIEEDDSSVFTPVWNRNIHAE